MNFTSNEPKLQVKHAVVTIIMKVTVDEWDP